MKKNRQTLIETFLPDFDFSFFIAIMIIMEKLFRINQTLMKILSRGNVSRNPFLFIRYALIFYLILRRKTRTPFYRATDHLRVQVRVPG
jgi:hypothetical protein